MAIEAAQGSVGTDDPMARNIWCKWVTTQRLSHSLGAATAYAACQFTISDGLATWHLEQCEIHSPLEFGDVARLPDLAFYTVHGTNIIHWFIEISVIFKVMSIFV